jgi:hypothetical protein
MIGHDALNIATINVCNPDLAAHAASGINPHVFQNVFHLNERKSIR